MSALSYKVFVCLVLLWETRPWRRCVCLSGDYWGHRPVSLVSGRYEVPNVTS